MISFCNTVLVLTTGSELTVGSHSLQVHLYLSLFRFVHLGVGLFEVEGDLSLVRFRRGIYSVISVEYLTKNVSFDWHESASALQLSNFFWL